MKRIIGGIIGLVLVAGVIHAQSLNPTVSTNYTTNVTSRVVITNNVQLFTGQNETLILRQLRAITNRAGNDVFKNPATRNGKLILTFSTNTINAVFIPNK